MPKQIPVWSYLDEYEALREDILKACDRVFRSGRLIFGEEGRNFEREIAEQLGVAGGVGVNSGTDALIVALEAVGVGQGDEVITVPNTAVPTASAIVATGARPVFVDIRPEDFLMDAGKIEAVITERTKALLPVHLYGQCADMDPILAIAECHGLQVIEDVAQAQGADYRGRPAGSMGHASAFSFYPTKVLGGYGDGGMVLIDDEEKLALARSLRFYGMETQYYSERHGHNSRLDELQAAILSLKLGYLEGWIERRREIANLYREGLAETGLTLPVENDYGRHTYYVYVVEHPDRDAVLERLAERDILCNVSYRWPIHIMRGFADLGYQEGDFPEAERKANRIFSLPMHPYLSDDDAHRVVETVKEIL